MTEGGDAVFTVELSGKVSQDVMVAYEVDGTEGEDSPLTIDPEKTTGTITVGTMDNMMAEASKTVTVTLTGVTVTGLQDSVQLGTTKATATVTDNDPLTVILEGPDRVPEGASAPEYTVRLRVGAGSGTGDAPVEIDYTVDGTAHELSIPRNTSSLEIPTANTGISGKQEDDTLVVRLTDADTTAGRVSLGTPREKRTAIVHRDTVTILVEDPTGAVAEGEDAEFPVRSDSGAAGVTVQYQVVPGSANSADYERPSGSLVLSVNGSGTITVAVVDDGVVEAAEEFSVRLTGRTLPPGVENVELGDTTATAMIEADGELTATLSVQPETVLEGNSAMFVVMLNGKSNENIVHRI